MVYTTIVRFNSPHQAGLVLESRQTHKSEAEALAFAERALSTEPFVVELDTARLLVPWHVMRGVEVLPGDHTQDGASFFEHPSAPLDHSPSLLQ